MATTYTLDWTNGSKPSIVLGPGDSNLTTTDLSLYGENSFLWGEGTNENFMHLLENFSDDSAPTNPTSGQLWFDTSINTLKVYNGATWNIVSGSGGTYPPTPDGTTFIYQSADYQMSVTTSMVDAARFDRAYLDPYNLYGGPGASFTATNELLAPPGATKMKIKGLMIMVLGWGGVGQDLSANSGNDRITVAISENPASPDRVTPWSDSNTEYVSATNWTTAFPNFWLHINTPWLDVPLRAPNAATPYEMNFAITCGGTHRWAIVGENANGDGNPQRGTWAEIIYDDFVL